MKWFEGFWNEHGERLIFAGLALGLAALLHKMGLKAQSEVIIIGIAMLFYNKVRTGKIGKNNGNAN